MKLNDGDIIEVSGKQGTVCFNAEYNGNNYVCVSFFEGEESAHYEICDYKFEDGKLLVARVTDKEELDSVMKIFFEKGLDEVGFPEELSNVIEEKMVNQEED